MDDLPIVEAKILRVEPGDIIALRLSEEISVEQAQRSREYGEAAFPGHTVAVLSGGIDLVVVREAEPM
jgi:hypothetical protein